MWHSDAMGRFIGVILLLTGVSAARQAPPAANQSTKHPYTPKDWSILRNARAIAVSPDGAILYQVGFGAEKGPTNSEWWTVAASGTHATKLELSDDFSPAGFTADGAGLFGSWKVNKQQQLAIFPLVNGKASAVPATVVMLPRGMESVMASPDAKRFAVVADPRPADSLENVRHVIDAGQSSLYICQCGWYRWALVV